MDSTPRARAIVLAEADNVATALAPAAAGAEVALTGARQGSLRAREEVPFGHKLALAAIPRGSRVLKYGAAIGVASQDIGAGEWVHVHNLLSQRGKE